MTQESQHAESEILMQQHKFACINYHFSSYGNWYVKQWFILWRVWVGNHFLTPKYDVYGGTHH
jgi:hypothetical protein